MKKYIPMLTGLFILLLSLNVHAQSKTGADYFADTWTVLVKGLPQGDTKMLFVIEKRSDSLSGVVQDSTGMEITKIDKVDLKDTTATIYFSTQGYDVNLVLNKKDDDHVTGSLMNMFDAEGERKRIKK
jgi:hypothetical protein